ncbi:Late secretory pathway protein AVL9 [Nymphon striatum]|nr:Late secretory pathway protein AVL9 [Nymphon striatum]
MSKSEDKTNLNDGPILHVVVVGFHHKKGCQVEYSYPPLIDGEPVNSQEIPDEWKHLPSLALPDGAHNYEKDTIYFHLPARGNSKQTVYGISCYRQMASEALINRSSDVTRGSVQKSVCVISTLPLYGLIQAKLALITHAYFDERDFSQVSLLQETYQNLSQSLTQTLLSGSQVFLGLSARDFVLTFKHKALLLFKLMLLERKVRMIEQGLKHAASVNSAKKYSSDMKLNSENDFVEVQYTKSPLIMNEEQNETDNVNKSPVEIASSVQNLQYNRNEDSISAVHNLRKKNNYSITNENEDKSLNINENSTLNELESMLEKESKEKVDLTKSKLQFCHDEDMCDTNVEPHSPSSLNSLKLDDCGLPLDVNVRSFVFGATNVLFKQKKHLLDVIVEINDGKVEIIDPELKKQLQLSMEDLRFADYLVRHVGEGNGETDEDVFLDGTGWEGGDEWLRAQFKWYLLSLLRSSQLESKQHNAFDIDAMFNLLLANSWHYGNKEFECFNSSFVSAWKTTHNYKMWMSGNHMGILEVNPGHPFHGNISMADMKLRLSHSMSSSEKGRKINQAVSSTGRYVSQTGKAVGKFEVLVVFGDAGENILDALMLPFLVAGLCHPFNT